VALMEAKGTPEVHGKNRRYDLNKLKRIFWRRGWESALAFSSRGSVRDLSRLPHHYEKHVLWLNAASRSSSNGGAVAEPAPDSVSASSLYPRPPSLSTLSTSSLVR